MADFGGRGSHAPGNDFGRVLRARFQPILKHIARRRQHEHEDDVALQLFRKLLRALPIDVEQHVLAGGDRGFDRLARRTVVIVENARPFEKLAARLHRLEPIAIDEVIVDAVLLAGARRACRDRHRHLDAAVGGKQPAGERRFPSARWR